MKFSKNKLKEELLRESKVLGIQLGAAELLADRVVTEVEKWAKKRTMITEADLNRVVAREVKKYNVDLAYVYQNRGKII
ncbi:hypothetical protein IKG54_01150 [Candidatus Saccharibacteria bacterium]|nr:hypothetical protein [Candidatus Saccharibacteria bacterium]